MRDFFRTRTFKAALIVLLLCVALMFAYAAAGGRTDPVSTAIGTVLSPLQRFSSWIGDKATGWLQNIVDADWLRDENDRLRLELAELHERLADYEELRLENEQYRAMLGIKEEHDDFTMLPATVVGRYPNERFSSFVIGVGSRDGVSLYDPVMTHEGLVGYISELAPTFARVQTILDPSLSVWALDVATRETGGVTGTVELALEGLCKFSYIDRHEGQVAPGDLIVSAGGSGVFPAGLVIGTVRELVPEFHGISLYAVLEPAADPRTVTNVVVLTDFAGKGESLEQFVEEN